MTVDRNHTEILDQPHQMWAEGIGISKLKPKEAEIRELLGGEGWKADQVDVWFDRFQDFWRWSCKIVKQ